MIVVPPCRVTLLITRMRHVLVTFKTYRYGLRITFVNFVDLLWTFYLLTQRRGSYVFCLSGFYYTRSKELHCTLWVQRNSLAKVSNTQPFFDSIMCTKICRLSRICDHLSRKENKKEVWEIRDCAIRHGCVAITIWLPEMIFSLKY